MCLNSVCRGNRCLDTNDTKSRFDSAACEEFDARMNDAPDENYRPILLRQDEVARRLRCSIAHVQQLRLKRKLGYIRGRPVTIIEKDVEIYVAWAKIRRVKAGRESTTFKFVSASASPKPFSLLTRIEAATKFGRSPRQIRYLCLHGHVPYILGRPPLIDESDLVEFFERKRLAALAKIPPLPDTPEFEALQAKKAEERMFHRLRVKAVKRRVERILKERAAQESRDATSLATTTRRK